MMELHFLPAETFLHFELQIAYGTNSESMQY